MEGDERERLCRQCDKKVYNISNMSKKEAEALLMSNSKGERKCVKFYQRKDGTITTDECPKFLRPVRDQYRRAAYAASMISAFIISVVGAKTFLNIKDVPKAIETFQYFPVDPRYGASGEVGGGMFGIDLVDFYLQELKEGMRILSEDVVSRLTLNELYFKRIFETEVLEQLKAAYLNKHLPDKAFKCDELIVAIKLEDSRFASRTVELITELEDRRQTQIREILDSVNYDQAFFSSDLVKALHTGLEIANCKPPTVAFTLAPIEYHNRTVYKDGERLVQIAVDKDNKILFRQLLEKFQPTLPEDIVFKNKMLSVFPPLE